VPVVGVEPTLLAEHDFECRASTSSATPAKASMTGLAGSAHPYPRQSFQSGAYDGARGDICVGTVQCTVTTRQMSLMGQSR
jgi:hypothetical protein